MRFDMEQRVVHNRMQWVLFDRRAPRDVMSYGSFVSISNLCREWNDVQPRLTQQAIDKRNPTEQPLNTWQQLLWKIGRRGETGAVR